jgi:hypothetical protein
VLAKEYCRNALVTMALASAKPNNEWSVNTVHRPNKLPMNKAYKDNENKKCSQIEEVPKTFLTRTQKLADKADYTIYKLGFKFC